MTGAIIIALTCIMSGVIVAVCRLLDRVDDIMRRIEDLYRRMKLDDEGH